MDHRRSMCRNQAERLVVSPSANNPVPTENRSPVKVCKFFILPSDPDIERVTPRILFPLRSVRMVPTRRQVLSEQQKRHFAPPSAPLIYFRNPPFGWSANLSRLSFLVTSPSAYRALGWGDPLILVRRVHCIHSRQLFCFVYFQGCWVVWPKQQYYKPITREGTLPSVQLAQSLTQE